MFPPLTRSYESGFSRIINNPEGVLDITPDQEVVDLFTEMTSGVIGTTNWPFVRRLVLCARRLFDDDLPGWLKSQERNTKLSNNARAFLNETVAYINTGVRPVPVGARLRILVRERQFAKVDTGTIGIDVITDQAIKPLTQWLRRDDGIVDMVFTLNVLFGKALQQ